MVLKDLSNEDKNLLYKGENTVVRFTFNEIKQLKHEDVFWSGNDEYVVTNSPAYINTSNFYGDYSQIIEWTAQSKTTLRESTFQVSNTKIENEPQDPMIFKIGSL